MTSIMESEGFWDFMSRLPGFAQRVVFFFVNIVEFITRELTINYMDYLDAPVLIPVLIFVLCISVLLYIHSKKKRLKKMAKKAEQVRQNGTAKQFVKERSVVKHSKEYNSYNGHPQRAVGQTKDVIKSQGFLSESTIEIDYEQQLVLYKRKSGDSAPSCEVPFHRIHGVEFDSKGFFKKKYYFTLISYGKYTYDIDNTVDVYKAYLKDSEVASAKKALENFCQACEFTEGLQKRKKRDIAKYKKERVSAAKHIYKSAFGQMRIEKGEITGASEFKIPCSAIKTVENLYCHWPEVGDTTLSFMAWGEQHTVTFRPWGADGKDLDVQGMYNYIIDNSGIPAQYKSIAKQGFSREVTLAGLTAQLQCMADQIEAEKQKRETNEIMMGALVGSVVAGDAGAVIGAITAKNNIDKRNAK